MKKAAEMIWKRILGTVPEIRCDQYVVSGNALTAIVESEGTEPQSEIGQSIADFRYLCAQEWPGGDFWGPTWRIRALDTRDKLREAGDLIVQLTINSED